MALQTYIDPRGTTATDWCDRMTLDLESFGPIPRLIRDSDWKQWARDVVELSGISNLNPPGPDVYADEEFERWAIDFNFAVVGG